MATPKEIKSRILAVQNTKKITSTMEMISAAKAKKAVDKVQAAQPYAKKINELISGVSGMGADCDHPLLRVPEISAQHKRKTGILVVTANRGLCGGFNNNVIKLALSRITSLQSEGQQVDVHLVGKKAATVFKYRKIPYSKSYTNIEDRPSIKDAEQFADYFMEEFEAGRLDSVEIVYTKYVSSSRQTAVLEKVLPLSLGTSDVQVSGASQAALFEPDAVSILSSLLPQAIRVAFYQALLDSAAGEQIARRVAMKNATDAATDIIRDMTRQYNRVRQAKITQEISEIVAGADSIS